MHGPTRIQGSRSTGNSARRAVAAGAGIAAEKGTNTMKEAKAMAGAGTMIGVDPS